jgi:hypothetical protein
VEDGMEDGMEAAGEDAVSDDWTCAIKSPACSQAGIEKPMGVNSWQRAQKLSARR